MGTCNGKDDDDDNESDVGADIVDGVACCSTTALIVSGFFLALSCRPRGFCCSFTDTMMAALGVALALFAFTR